MVVGLPYVHGVAGMTGAGGGRAVGHVEEVSEHGLERVPVMPMTQRHKLNRVRSFV